MSDARMRLIGIWLGMVCLAASALAQTPANSLVDELSGRASGPQRDAAQLAAAYDQALNDLVPRTASGDPAERQAAMLSVERIANFAARPNAESDRLAFAQAVCKRLSAETPAAARLWLLRKLETVGASECVETLATCLNDSDPLLRDAGRRALEQNPTPDALNALTTAALAATDPDWKAALLNALARRDPPPVNVIAPLVFDQNETVAIAAIQALANCRDRTATQPLFTLAKDLELPKSRRAAVMSTLLRLADAFHAAGEDEPAALIYKLLSVVPTSPPLRAAVLRGRAAMEDERMLADLLNLVCSKDVEMLRETAARLMAEMKGATVTGRITARAIKTEPDYMPLLLEALGDRGDASALPDIEVILMARSEPPVRIAALSALGKLGGAAQITTLARAASEGNETVRAAARTALNGLRGADVDERMIAALDGAAPALLAELVQALNARGSKAALEKFFTLAEHADDSVATAALEAIPTQATERDLSRLIEILSRSRTAMRERAENAAARVALKNADANARAAPILAAIGSAKPDALPSLLRVAGRLGGSQAFATIRTYSEQNKGPVADAALRALAEWQDVEAIPALRAMAGNAELDTTYRILAVRGLVRLIRKPSDRPAEETFDLLSAAMALATRPEEVKQVLGGFGELALPQALEKTRACMKDAALRDEAATATVAVARRVAATNRPAALEAIAEVQSSLVGEARKKTAGEALEFIDAHAGFVAGWEYAGPYSQTGKNAADLYAIAFPPEPGAAALPADANGPASPEWKPLTCHSAADAWIFDLTKIDKSGARCLYVRATIQCDAEQPARLELGSDDGIMGWLNGQLVHTNKASRPVSLSDDKVDVTLKPGPNTLLLKIVQGDGGWGFCCAVRGRDGKPLASVK